MQDMSGISMDELCAEVITRAQRLRDIKPLAEQHAIDRVTIDLTNNTLLISFLDTRQVYTFNIADI